ncbi:MAG: hypothetical protein F6K26_20555 [Moorea sp. SIO2I5]|nr:hypothetical protein [Moorena sp. SIO2I5]
MNIYDLNHIEVVNEETNIVGGRRGRRRGRRFKLDIDKEIDLDIRVDIDKDVDSRVKVKGRLANAEATAEFVGKGDFLVETDTDAFIGPRGGSAFSVSVVAAD